MSLPSKSLMQYRMADDGQVEVSLCGRPLSGPINIVPQAGPVRDWLAELDLPKDWARLDEMAQATTLSTRKFSAVLLDESRTLYPGAWRFRPQDICHDHPGGYPVTLSHTGFTIGRCDSVWRLPVGARVDTEGVCLVVEATLYDSALARAAWAGIERHIFGHVSAVILHAPNDPVGAGSLLEFGITDFPGCRNAKILKWWDTAESEPK